MHRLLIMLAGAPLLIGSPIPFIVQNIASNATDPNLVNAWGITASNTSPFWIGANGSGVALIYNSAGVNVIPPVMIPGDGSVSGAAFNGSSAAFNGDPFLFDSEDGTISGWRNSLGSSAEQLQAGSSSNVYKGIATGTVGGLGHAYP